MSSKNPFRQPPPSEPEVTVVPPSPGQRSPSTNPPTLPPRSPTSGPSSQSQILASPPSGPATHLGTSTSPTIAEIIEDDLPPPYTPSPNVSIGEETVGLGPPRPFQPPPPQPPSSLHPPAESHSYSNRPPRPLQPNPTGPVSYSSAYSQPYPQSDMASWQTQQQYRQRQNGGGGLIGALLDTVRDIADTFSGAHDDLALQRGNTGGYTAPGSYSSTNAMYAPPPGSRLPPRRPASTPPRSPPTIPDDGSPTRTPAPGHPLLRDGYLLVYPRDYLCVKCAFFVFHFPAVMHVFTHEQAGTQASKTMIPPIHVANAGKSTPSRIPARSRTRRGRPRGTIPGCSVRCQSLYRPTWPGSALSRHRAPLMRLRILSSVRRNTPTIAVLSRSHITHLHRGRRTTSRTHCPPGIRRRRYRMRLRSRLEIRG